MATASQAPAGTDLQQLARQHLWMHFSRMGGYGPDHEIPIITRAEGCYVYDEHGNRYLDGLSGLFCCNAGHGRTEYGEAAARQVEELDFYTLWSYAHPKAIELAARIASMTPGDLNRVFFTSGGSEAVESALKLARNYHRVHGKGQKHEVICAWGRLGHYFGCDRFDYVPDMITVAKALTSAYAPMGGLIASDKVAAPFMEGDASFAHGFTFAGHPIAAAIAMANLDVFEQEDLCGHVLRKEGEFRQMLESLHELPIVGDVRGAGYFHAVELVKDKETKESFNDEESEKLLRGFLSGELYKRGLICRADDRGDPVVQLAPPLIADTEQFEEIHEVLHSVLSEAWDQVVGGSRSSTASAPRRRSSL